MAQPFTHSAESLRDFFAQPGRGFYVPYYQRNYSWDKENAEQLISDVFSGIKDTLIKSSSTVFLGTVILHEEKNVAVGTHADTPNLLTKISNVVDGQQRITSIAMLAAAISYALSELVSKLKSFNPPLQEFTKLADELDNERRALAEFYSVEIRKNGAQPPLKPVVIRAGDVATNPVSDQWTLAGTAANFYRSNTSHFLSDFINGVPLPAIQTDERIEGVLEVFRDQIESETNSADIQLANSLLRVNGQSNGSLYSFMAYPPNLQNVQARPVEEQKTFYGAMLLLAACSYLKNSCNLVVIECQDEDLAFDMFQSLNGTGTPLTAFEVFKPALVRAWGTTYATAIKPQVDRIEQVFEKKSTAGEKGELTGKVIVSSALGYNGKEISRRLSDERRWLFNAFPAVPNAQATTLITCIADMAEYCEHFELPRRLPKDSINFRLVTHLQRLGLSVQQADLSALCIYYLRDAGHHFAHSVLRVFYSKLLRAQGNTAAVATAAAEFLAVCKATAAFFTLWMGSAPGRFPDAAYRDLFQSATANMSVFSGAANQTEVFLKRAFRAALQQQGVYDATNVAAARQLWVSKATQTAWYLRKAVCRFALFASAHDAAPDLAPGNEGLFINGMANSADFLNCRAWHSSEYEVIEHVAPRDKPTTIKFPNHFDQTIYPGNYSIVDKLGNLTLLSIKINSSIYSEWPDKVYYYWTLTTPTNTTQGPTGAALQAALGISNIPAGLIGLTAASSYLSQLAPLAYRGQQGLKWTTLFVEQRSKHLCERVFDKLDPWLR